MNWRWAVVKSVEVIIPHSWLISLILRFPRLYKTRFVSYESYLFDSFQEIFDALSLTQEVEGNIVEFGSARCGTSAFIGDYLKQKKMSKKIYALDTFGAGFDKEELKREKLRGWTNVTEDYFTDVTYNYVQAKIRSLGLEEYVIPIKGLFQQTFDSIAGNFCLAIVDCDLSESISYSLESVWNKLSTNGIILVDDYDYENYKGVPMVVDEFVRKKSQECEARKLKRLFKITKIN